MTATALERSRAKMIAEALCGILQDSAPQPWTTMDLQRSFGWRDRQRVYTQLMKLWGELTVYRFRELDCCWWTWAEAEPTCWLCGASAQRIIRRPDGIWVDRKYQQTGWRGGYLCQKPKCVRQVVNLAGPTLPEWPWPDPSGLVDE